MKNLPASLALLLALSLGGPSASADATGPKDLISAAIADGRFQVLTAALNQAGLVPALRADGPLTVFAPTDDAFAALPEGVVARLLRPENRPALLRVLQSHVASGRILAADLLPVVEVRTLAGETFSLGLRVGAANVTQADVLCSNGVIHVIDAVLLPSPSTKRDPIDVAATLRRAIDQGVPLFNVGDEQACADVYHHAAARVLEEGGDALSDYSRWDLERALAHAPSDPAKHAWALRDVFDRMLADTAFEPKMEAELPSGFPQPGPVGRVVRKSYPKYRAARAASSSSMGAFWTLFQHIKKNNVEMTAPVEMTMGQDMRMRDMAFLYESATQGASGAQGSVNVLDLDRVDVLSIGMRGRRTEASLATAKKLVEARLAPMGLQAAGDWRVLGYNSPMVPAAQQYWELQIPVTVK